MTSSGFEFEAIGTHWQIDILQDIPEDVRLELQQAIHTRIEQFDKDYSRFRADSLVTTMSRQTGEYLLPPDAKAMIDLYRDLYEISGGMFTPLIGNVLEDAGYDPQYSLEAKPLTKPPSWDEALVHAFPKLTILKPVMLDFGAAGKGYLIDIVAGVIKQAGIASYCVDAGGDIAYHHVHGTPIRVGLEHPGDTSRVIGVVELANRSIAGSAGNRRAWGEFHHIIDPKTLASPRHISAVWTMAETTLLADAMSTALFFMPVESLKKRYTFEYLIMNADGSVQASPGFTHELY